MTCAGGLVETKVSSLAIVIIPIAAIPHYYLAVSVAVVSLASSAYLLNGNTHTHTSLTNTDKWTQTPSCKSHSVQSFKCLWGLNKGDSKDKYYIYHKSRCYIKLDTHVIDYMLPCEQ